jgi:hypothetical protein
MLRKIAKLTVKWKEGIKTNGKKLDESCGRQAGSRPCDNRFAVVYVKKHDEYYVVNTAAYDLDW